MSALVLRVSGGPALGKNERMPKDLSEEEHYPGDGHDHNPDYDHEAFLGKEEAERFDQLPPQEAKRRLGIIVDKIDTNKDGQLTEEELQEWVRHVGRRFVYDDVDRVWSYHDKDGDSFISLDDYKNASYGNIKDLEEMYDHHRNMTYRQRIQKDERRFKVADQDGDGKMDKEEFADFLHPEESPRMFDVYIEETLEEMDEDGDRLVTLEEYLNDIWPRYERDPSVEEPDWVRAEKEGFAKHRDRDGDGVLNKEEIRHWLQPEGYDHSRSEAKHLVYNADSNKDKVLSKEEVLDSYDLFVGSQATEWGSYMMRHDEF